MYRYYLYHPDLKKPVRLKHAPVGWDSLNKKFTRDRKTHGIFFGYTPKLSFIKDGKSIIHTLYELYGPEVEIILIIKMRNTVNRTWDTDYVGKLNLMTLTISTLYAECNVEQTGFVQKFKNRQDVKVDIQSLVDLDGNAIEPFTDETHTVSLHSKDIVASFEANGLVETTDYVPPDFIPVYLHFPWEAVQDEILERFDYAAQISDTEPISGKKYAFKVKYAGVYTIEELQIYAHLTATIGFGVGDTLTFKLVYGRPGNYTTIVIGTAVEVGGASITFDDAITDTELTLAAGDEVYIFGEHNVTVKDPNTITYQTYNIDGPLFLKSYIKITAHTSFPATDTPVVLVHEAAARICQSIIGAADPLRSDYYGRTDSEPNTYDADGAGSLRGFTPGFWVRGFSKTVKSLHMSLKDLVDCLSTIDGVGIGIETIDARQYVVLAPLSHFYQPTEILKLNNVKDIEKTVAEDFYYNELEIGYKKWTVSGGAVNHLDEFNSKRDYSLPITQVKSKLSLLSPYIAGGNILETTRRDSVLPTKDNENDNEVFIIQLKRDGGDFETAKDEAFDSITGVLSPETVYNADLSPGRCLLRNGGLIRSFLEKQKDKTLRLTLSEGNSAMASKRTDEAFTVTEGADVAISGLARPLWLPELYRFKSPLDFDHMAALSANPYGYVSFSNSTKDHKKCYILDAERDAKSRLVTFTGIKANL